MPRLELLLQGNSAVSTDSPRNPLLCHRFAHKQDTPPKPILWDATWTCDLHLANSVAFLLWLRLAHTRIYFDESPRPQSPYQKKIMATRHSNSSNAILVCQKSFCAAPHLDPILRSRIKHLATTCKLTVAPIAGRLRWRRVETILDLSGTPGSMLNLRCCPCEHHDVHYGDTLTSTLYIVSIRAF